MVLVLNLNMAIDKTAYVESFNKGEIHRFNSALTLPGGKGVNVARALKTLRVPVEIMGFAGGYAGDWIEKQLTAEGLKPCLIKKLKGESRICYCVVEKNGCSTDFNEDGPKLEKKGISDFLIAYERKLALSTMVSISGRSVRGVPCGFYRALAKKAALKKIPFFADLSGFPLMEILSSNPVGIKINNYEFEHTFRTRFSPSSMKKRFFEYNRAGLEFMIVTNRHMPFYCITKEGFFEVFPPKLSLFKTPIGAGDSFMAALIKCRLDGKNIKDTLAFCTAAAACDCETLGAGIISLNGIRKYIPYVKIKESKL